MEWFTAAQHFTKALASAEPTPGGGAAAAHAAAMGCALAMMAAGGYFLIKYEPRVMELVDIKSIAIVAAGGMVFGILITMTCARISINRFLRMKAGDLYYI